MSEGLRQRTELTKKCNGVWHSCVKPAEELDSGVLMSYEDFLLACEVTGQKKAEATYVFRHIIYTLAQEDVGDDLRGALRSMMHPIPGIPGHNETHCLYLETQIVHELIELMATGNYVLGLGEKSLDLMRAAVYDEPPATI